MRGTDLSKITGTGSKLSNGKLFPALRTKHFLFLPSNDLISQQTKYSTRSLTTLNFNTEVSGAPSADGYH